LKKIFYSGHARTVVQYCTVYEPPCEIYLATNPLVAAVYLHIYALFFKNATRMLFFSAFVFIP
jgi:hypothetical protein